MVYFLTRFLGGPVSVTHRHVTRFFMMIPEASDRLIQDVVVGNGWEALVLKRDEPVRIVEVAEPTIALSGKPIQKSCSPAYGPGKRGTRSCPRSSQSTAHALVRPWGSPRWRAPTSSRVWTATRRSPASRSSD